MSEQEKSPLVIALSVGTATLIGLCCVLLAAAVVGVGAAIVFTAGDKPKPVVELRRPGLRGDVKGDIEATLGPVDSSKLNEIKNCGLVNRIRARRARAYQPAFVPQYEPAPYVEPQPYLQPDYGPTPYPNPEPVILPESVPMVPVPVMPESNCPDGRCPRPVNQLGSVDRLNEAKTGGLNCASCKRETVGQQWHTEWVNGEPRTSVCEACYRRGLVAVVGSYPSR